VGIIEIDSENVNWIMLVQDRDFVNICKSEGIVTTGGSFYHYILVFVYHDIQQYHISVYPNALHVLAYQDHQESSYY
jgi:hypothetical protein